MLSVAPECLPYAPLLIFSQQKLVLDLLFWGPFGFLTPHLPLLTIKGGPASEQAQYTLTGV